MSEAMLPPAPGLFSITTVWPHTSCRRLPTRRAVMSVEPPGGNGTTMRTILSGQFALSAREARMDGAAMEDLPESQPVRARPRAGGGQNGGGARAPGLPDSGQGFEPPFDSPASLVLPAAWGGLAGIQPAEADRKALAAQ